MGKDARPPKRRKMLLAAIIAAAVALIMGLVICLPSPKKKLPSGPYEYSAWLVDWQWKAGLAELEPIAPALSSLQLFAAYFDENNQLLIRDDSKFLASLPELISTYRGLGGKEVYLTIVNDRIIKDETAVQKEPEIISALVADKSSRQLHTAAIMEQADRFSLDGVELDYERVKEQDWERLIELWRELYAQLDSRGKKLRIVLEPRAPLERLKLPDGPQYVMMAYNLYGPHSGPGPKADPDFVKKQAKRMMKLVKEPVIAFATGGFDWDEEQGKAAAVTEVKALELAKRAEHPPERDQASGALSFRYRDEEQQRHVVWYADHETLRLWTEAAREEGAGRFALWRLGGSEPDSLQQLLLQGAN